MPTTPTLTSGTVMDSVAAALNDVAKSTYPYTIQLPYLNIALNELQEIFELNDMPVTEDVSTVMSNILAGTSALIFGGSSPKLPDDLIEPKHLWEREHNTDPYTPMSRVDELPLFEEGIEINQFLVFTWQSNQIRFLTADQNNDIKMLYVRRLFTAFTDVTGNDNVNVINAQSFLTYRTAGLVARYVEENKPRADDLDQNAQDSIDRALGISTKGRQAIMIRRRPFRSGYKSRGSF